MLPKQNKFLSLIFLILVFVSSSCDKFLNVDVAPELVQSDLVFESETTALSAINGVYTRMRNLANDLTSNGVSVFGGLLADELYNTASNATYDPFSTNTVMSNNETVNVSLWRNPYRNIYNINAIVEGVEKSTTLTETAKLSFIAEARFLRAWHYFYLVNLFGDVPLITATAYENNSVMPRTPTDSIYKLLIEDLKFAKANLSSSYPSAGRLRPNKWTAATLLARCYLYTKEWQLAIDESSQVIESKQYQLKEDLNAVFLINSEEIIWSMAAANDASNSTFGLLFIPVNATSRPAIALRTSLVDQYTLNDKRADQWIRFSTNGGVQYYYPYKYKQRVATIPIQEHNVMLRYAEVYLVRAEAFAELEELTLSKIDLDMIRRRAGLGGSTAGNKHELLADILQERRLELFSEWGHRWLDLKRRDLVDQIISAEKGNAWQSTDVLLPLHLSELLYNPNLHQNPGY